MLSGRWSGWVALGRMGMGGMALGGMALLAPGCAWVSSKDVAERLTVVDDDGDGVNVSVDCDDHDGRRFPGAEDPPYDGYDADCAGDDDYDVDVDGYVADAYAGLPTEGVPGSGALPAGDCDDAASGVHPGATDAWYDGVDTDCGGEDDYDADGDRYVSDAYFGLPTTYAEDAGVLPGGDCDDGVVGVNPASGDDWYDGVDSNCSGNDDYDQDGDGYVRVGDGGRMTMYVVTSGALPDGDCDDGSDEVYPGAPDAWYDDLDADCRGDDDFDQDLDGYDLDVYGGEDCDDRRADVHPGLIETVGDSVDTDCNGGMDGFVIAPFADATWTSPHAPVYVATETFVYLSVADVEVDLGVPLYDSAVALEFDALDPTAGPSGGIAWLQNTADPAGFSLADGQAVVIVGDTLYGVVGIDTPRGRGMGVARYNLTSGVRAVITVQGSGDYASFTDVGLAVGGDGVVHLVACEGTDGILAYAEVSGDGTGAPDINAEVADIYAGVCAIGADDGRAWIYTGESSGLVRSDYDTSLGDLALTLGPTVSGLDLLDLDWGGGDYGYLADAATAKGYRFAVVDGATSALEPGTGPVALDVTVAEGVIWYGYVTADGAAWLSYGPSVRAMTTFQLDPGFAAEDVAVWVANGYVQYAVTGSGQVAWGVALAG